MIELKYFVDDEFRCKHCGMLPRHGMNTVLMERLDKLRSMYGKPIYVSCGYRCPSHNAEVGGVWNSQHIKGTAADVQCPEGMTPFELAEIALDSDADGVGVYDWGVHVDVRGWKARW